VVFNVAIEIVEWSGGGVSNVHGSGDRAVSRGSAGDCGPTVAAVRFSPLVAITERTPGTVWGCIGAIPNFRSHIAPPDGEYRDDGPGDVNYPEIAHYVVHFHSHLMTEPEVKAQCHLFATYPEGHDGTQ
jgi:hypothetical protein